MRTFHKAMAETWFTTVELTCTVSWLPSSILDEISQLPIARLRHRTRESVRADQFYNPYRTNPKSDQRKPEEAPVFDRGYHGRGQNYKEGPFDRSVYFWQSYHDGIYIICIYNMATLSRFMNAENMNSALRTIASTTQKEAIYLMSLVSPTQ
ncbi:hypothetical protein AFLA_002742 [Aspergillus flavus NRRL3357]|nr:hypothetical protein AFLA_002742 [Aspergillus flavus NRRL3357]